MASLMITVSQLIVCIFLAATSIDGKPPSTIVGGPDADDKEFPYQVLLSERNQPTCGGSIIDSRHILTAAHCVTNDSINLVNYMVTTGTTNIESGQGKEHRIKSIKIHPEFIRSPLRNDIAIITLTDEIIFNSREEAVKLPTKDTPANVVATASGWGDTVYPDGRAPAKLRKLDVTTISNSECSKLGAIPDTLLCALSEKGSGICIGDSGGPLVHDGVIIGIASYVVPCGTVWPDFFTRVYKYVDWINEVVGTS